MKLPGRNEPCWCNSGKKYKKCHLRSDEKGETAPRTRIIRVIEHGYTSDSYDAESKY